MRTFSSNNRFWIEAQDGRARVGLTAAYLAKVGTVWTFAKRDKAKLVEGAPFANMETSRHLVTLRSPVNGTVEEWGKELEDTPEAITEDTWLMTVRLT
jgi:glycine cleavage system H lipoate-binding protein